ncbi:MAG: MCE family protein [Rubellimicrobium sp.]|nr:MCE family protein [Rubellimicrobium sp.]
METRANYILIGAFTLAGMLGIVAFVLWFARIELDRQFAYFDIAFTSVSGLSAASDVRFSGLPVGQVVSVGLSPDGDGTVNVRIEIDADTPVRTDSIATIESQGVTGVSFVGISPGTPEADLLVRTPGGPFPRIEAGRSALQSLSEDAPQILTETLSILEGVNNLLTDANQDRVDRILTNMEDASANFAAALEDFSIVTSSVSEFATQIDSFNATLEDLTGAMTGLLETADDTLLSIGTLAEDSRVTLSVLVETMTSTQNLLIEAERFIAEELSTTTGEIGRVADAVGAEVTVLSAEAQTMLATFTTTGTTANARLTEAQETLAAANAAIARVETTLDGLDSAAGSVEALMVGDGAALLAEARAAVAEVTRATGVIGEVAEADLPAIVAALRETTETVARVVEEVGADLTGSSGWIEALAGDARALISEVGETFASANETLAAVNAALETGDAALAAAARAFDGADGLINDEGATLVADLRATMATLDAAIAQVAGDIPAITGDLRSASAAAEEAFTAMNRLVAGSAAPVEAFTTTGLANYTRLAQEARSLVGNLEALTNQIQRDPARFFLNQQTPDFRR